ncbi:beta-galactosidase [Labedella phragmitis]|uniref:Beta-galactosidase n=1 Tax=Labedella phragmitis TaxID=2498849 RepID=A0A3S4A4A3_9MICO|nr:beta-galactosidase [Labedella phragmitis]RWZ51135.1 beta-galactosidase [Labedella phragmitis]
MTTHAPTRPTDTTAEASTDDGPAAEIAPIRSGWIPGTNRIAFGGDYNPEQWDRSVWLEDIALMKDAGVSLVSIGIFSWALLEPREGEYDFSFLDEVMDLLHEAGVAVDLGTPTAAPPAWFWKAHPEARPVTRDGLTLWHGSRGMASPSSSAYRAAVTRIADALAARYADHPALVLWHVHNEYGAPVSECYSDASSAAFRRWLRSRYGTLDALNTAWGTAFWGQRYGEWDEIDAPRTSASVVNPAHRLDFARYTSNALLECFVAERDAIKRHTPHLPVTTNFMSSNCPSIDYWKWSREVDIVANDYYLVAERADNHVLLALDADLTRSFAGGRPWILMEHSTGAVNWQPRNIAKRPGELARNSLVSVARGADAVLFFQFRASRSGAEKFHSAMLPHGGRTTRIWREVEALGTTLGGLADIMGGTVPARVAILWDVESFWAQDLEWRPSVDLDHRERVVAFYTELWRRDVPVDFAHPHADLSDYDVVLAPASYLLDDVSAANLRGVVEGGGRLVASYFSGIVDEYDAVPDGPYPGGLREVLGLRIDEFLPLHAEERPALDDGSVGSVWADDVVLEGAEAIATFRDGPAAGRAGVTRNTYGAGSAWYVSTALDADALGAVLERVLAEAGVPSRPAHDVAGVERVERRTDDEVFVFLANHGDADVAVDDVTGVDAVTGEAVSGVVVPGAGVRVVRSPIAS